MENRLLEGEKPRGIYSICCVTFLVDFLTAANGRGFLPVRPRRRRLSGERKLERRFARTAALEPPRHRPNFGGGGMLGQPFGMPIAGVAPSVSRASGHPVVGMGAYAGRDGMLPYPGQSSGLAWVPEGGSATARPVLWEAPGLPAPPSCLLYTSPSPRD